MAIVSDITVAALTATPTLRGNKSAPAVTEADRQLTLKGGAVRAIYVFTLKTKGLTRKIGDVVSLTFAPAGVTWFDLSSKLLTVVGRVDNTTEGTVEITAFG